MFLNCIKKSWYINKKYTIFVCLLELYYSNKKLYLFKQNFSISQIWEIYRKTKRKRII